MKIEPGSKPVIRMKAAGERPGFVDAILETAVPFPFGVSIVFQFILGLASALFTGSTLQAAEPKLKEYPLKICLVSDNKLGSMGKPYKFTHEEQRVELCCKPCLKKFTKEPVKYLKKLEPKKK